MSASRICFSPCAPNAPAATAMNMFRPARMTSRRSLMCAFQEMMCAYCNCLLSFSDSAKDGDAGPGCDAWPLTAKRRSSGAEDGQQAHDGVAPFARLRLAVVFLAEEAGDVHALAIEQFQRRDDAVGGRLLGDPDRIDVVFAQQHAETRVHDLQARILDADIFDLAIVGLHDAGIADLGHDGGAELGHALQDDARRIVGDLVSEGLAG